MKKCSLRESLDVLGDACDWVTDQYFQAINVLKDDSLIKSDIDTISDYDCFVTSTPSIP